MNNSRNKLLKKTVKEEAYSAITDKDTVSLITLARKGIQYSFFLRIAKNSPFTPNEWSAILHLSERTLQRYQKQKKSFDPIHSEKIIEIIILNNKGAEVFGDSELFNKWLESENIALGGVKPKELLDNTFGINLIKDELIRIEHGVLA
jgi:putative toxin-antitoxin system antitoxin component (TIGR02293 family)